MDDDLLADVLEELPDSAQVAILAMLDDDRAADILEEMDPGDAADLLGELTPEEQATLAGMRAIRSEALREDATALIAAAAPRIAPLHVVPDENQSLSPQQIFAQRAVLLMTPDSVISSQRSLPSRVRSPTPANTE